MAQFIVHGGRPLKGTVKISGSKNAALPILAATLLTDELCVIKNVPDIEDVRTMLAMLRCLGSDAKFKNNIVRIRTPRIKQNSMPDALGCSMRASVLLLGPLLARTGKARLPYPGGCILGARPIDTHTDVLKQTGVKKMPSGGGEIIFNGAPRGSHVVLPEFSVTATENVLMALSRATGASQIHLAALEPHVTDLAKFLQKMGVKISGIGSHTLTVKGAARLRGAVHSITPDYLEAGTFVLAAALTRGAITIKNIIPHDLDAFWNVLKGVGVKFKFYNARPAAAGRAAAGRAAVKILPPPRGGLRPLQRLQTNAHPGFPTDLQPPFAVLLTQARGESRIHEALFEGRFKYAGDLKKMGAKMHILNPHEAVINGPVALKARRVKSWDIRAGAAMILAALAAKGKSIIEDIHYIDRGYERFDEKLRGIGARIERL